MTERVEKITGILFPPPDASAVERAKWVSARWATLRRRQAPQLQISPDAPPLHIYDSVVADLQKQSDRDETETNPPPNDWFQEYKEITTAPDVPSQGRHARGRHALPAPAIENVPDAVIEASPGVYTVAPHLAALAVHVPSQASNLPPAVGASSGHP